MEDTFALFKEESYRNQFIPQLNSLHQSLPFNHEKETGGKPPSSDVLIEKIDTQFLTSVNANIENQYLSVSILIGIHLNLKAEKPI